MVHVAYPGRLDPSWVWCWPGMWNIVFRLMCGPPFSFFLSFQPPKEEIIHNKSGFFRCEPTNQLNVEFGPIYKPNNEEKADALLFSRRVQHRMADFFGKPATSHSYDDVRLQSLANKVVSLSMQT